MIKNSKKIALSLVATVAIATSVNADFLGAEVGYAAWSPSLTGDIRKGTGTLDFEKDLGYGSSEANSFMWAYIDHPLPLIPNLKVQKTNYTDSASGTIASSSVTFAGVLLPTELASTSVTLNQLDVIPYWRILDNWVNLDIGFNFKSIDGNVKIDTLVTNKHANTDFSAVIPMLYAKARFDMPFTGLSVEADISYISLAGNSFSDMKAGVVYETTFGLGATLGIRQEKLTLDDIDGVYGDVNIEGIYAGVFFHF